MEEDCSRTGKADEGPQPVESICGRGEIPPWDVVLCIINLITWKTNSFNQFEDDFTMPKYFLKTISACSHWSLKQFANTALLRQSAQIKLESPSSFVI